MSDFLSRILSGYQQLNVSNCSVLIAVSGGADSIALLRSTLELENELQIKIVAAHLNHGLRGKNSDLDSQWLSEACHSLQIPFVTEKQDVESIARNEQIGIEEAARNTRYEFLIKVAQEHSCPFLAVAHTQNDQAETILHHILRGTGLSGLQGIPHRRILNPELSLIRPMLSVTREEVEHYLNTIRQDHRIDESNSDSKWTRNRIRNELLPHLRENYNPKIDEALVRLGQQSSETSSSIAFLVNDILQEAVVDRASDTVRFKIDSLILLPRNLIRECFKMIWVEKNWPRQRMGFKEWDQLAELTLNGGSYSFPGQVYAEKRNQLLICRREANNSD